MRKILIVEDDSFISDIYRVKFSEEGFAVDLAENGIEALKNIEKNVPDIILLDIIMPYMDGMELLRNIRKNESWKKIPIVILTNISEKEKIDESMENEVSGYLVKSNFTPSEVVDKINSLLKK